MSAHETGRCYEDYAVGEVIEHPLGRTVTQNDNIWFTLLTNNTNPIHFDAHYAAQTEFGRPLVNSCLTIALVTGLSVADMSRNAVNLGWDEVRIPHPLFEGDTVYAQSEVLELRESRSRPTQGVMVFRTTGYNQHGQSVLVFRRTVLVYRRGHVPALTSRPVLQEPS
ncbi:MaoC family dehydratase [Deinococcus sp. KSM4-11]|uniref:MaoC family dehydratase n=1 Tax=Deinococcus sp. KSM4-11 TaxID=2568654 RepID=UPI0010A365E5|nr:MaoC family dehydratase [Deinococcus sp. KSM4-11]THF85451.1 MaoC family dehydratase [Deinococcus sp. KSM4-11]